MEPNKNQVDASGMVEPCLTIKQTANLLKISVAKLFKMLKEGTAPKSFTFGESRRFRQASIREWQLWREREEQSHPKKSKHKGQGRKPSQRVPELATME